MRFSLVTTIVLLGCGPAAPPPVTGAGSGSGSTAVPASAPSATSCASRRPVPGPTRLCGRAENAKGGAVLLLDDRSVVYVLGLESWPDELHRKRVLASGRFGQKKLYPDPAPPGAEQTQGAFGDQLVLDGASWQLAK